MEVDCQFFKSRTDAAELLEPTDALLHHMTLTISLLVEPGRRVPSLWLIILIRNHRLNLLQFKPLAQRLRTVALVAGELPRFATTLETLAATTDQLRRRFADDALGLRTFVDLPGGDRDGKGSSLAVSNHMEL